MVWISNAFQKFVHFLNVKWCFRILFPVWFLNGPISMDCFIQNPVHVVFSREWLVTQMLSEKLNVWFIGIRHLDVFNLLIIQISGNGYSYPFNPLAPPQHETKKFKGIVRYYNKCVGSSLRTHVEAPCIFPFIYQGQVVDSLRLFKPRGFTTSDHWIN
jgi:hypothetical protein